MQFRSKDGDILPIPHDWQQYSGVQSAFSFEEQAGMIKYYLDHPYVEVDVPTFALFLAFGKYTEQKSIVMQYGVEALVFADKMTNGQANMTSLVQTLLSGLSNEKDAFWQIIALRETKCTYLMRATSCSQLNTYLSENLLAQFDHSYSFRWQWSRLGDADLTIALRKSYPRSKMGHMNIYVEEKSNIIGSGGSVDYYRKVSEHNIVEAALANWPKCSPYTSKLSLVYISLTLPSQELANYFLSHIGKNCGRQDDETRFAFLVRLIANDRKYEDAVIARTAQEQITPAKQCILEVGLLNNRRAKSKLRRFGLTLY